jgi:bacillolysin
MTRFAKCTRLLSGLLVLLPVVTTAGEIALRSKVAATDPAATAQWSARIDTLVQRGDLRVRREEPDRDLPGHRHVRYGQYVRGVRVFGGEVVRHVDGGGAPVSVFGSLAEDTDVDVRPAIDGIRAMTSAEADMGRGARAEDDAELVLLPIDGRLRLAYSLHCGQTEPLAVRHYFIDALTAEVLHFHSDLQTDTAVVGIGTGVWADRKRLSVTQIGSTFFGRDSLRPSRINTYDARNSQYVLVSPGSWTSYMVTDSDNTWGDGGAVDGHAYFGWAYDYYYEQHGRRGVDDFNGATIEVFINAMPFECNAAFARYAGREFFMFGGYGYIDPSGVRCVAKTAGLDTVGHEYTHAVTEHSWRGEYAFESGALNEAFSDIMANSVEWFYQPAGDGRLRADWWHGEDASEVWDPQRYSVRSLVDPTLFGQPDHYSRLFGLPYSVDNGGVHYNSGIVNNAFYLLVEGGTNKTSGRSVQGLGAANRVRAEKIFYRGFTQKLTALATFSQARVATIQAARELYGLGSSEESKVTQAWSAVGVE